MSFNENEFIHLGIVFFYFFLTLVGFSLAYRVNNDYTYYASKSFIYHPLNPSKSRFLTVLSITARFINGPTMLVGVEILQTLGLYWLIIPFLLPFSIMIASFLYIIPLKYLQYTSLEMLFHKSAGPFAFIYYLLIVLSKIFVLAASFSVLQSFLTDSGIITEDLCVWTIGLLSVLYTVLGGLTLITMADKIQIFLSFLILTFITAILMRTTFEDKVNIKNLQNSVPINNIPFYFDSCLTVILGGFIEPLCIYSYIFYSEYHKYSYIIIGSVICCILLFFFGLNVLSSIMILRVDNTSKIIRNNRTVSYILLILHKNSIGVFKFFLLGSLGACFMYAHNQILVDTTYILCTNTLRMITERHIHKDAKLWLHQGGSAIITFIAIMICLSYYPNISCLLMFALDINYTLIFPQIIAGYFCSNFIGAISSLIFSITVRIFSMDLILCGMKKLVLNPEINFIKFLLPKLKINVIPIRTTIVTFSVLLNVIASCFGRKLLSKSILKRFFDEDSNELYLIDEQVTSDISSASIRMKWDMISIQSTESKYQFPLKVIPEINRFYKVIPEDLTHKLYNLSKKSYFFDFKHLFKVPLQNRLTRKELTFTDRRRLLTFNKLLMEWLYCCHIKGIQLCAPLNTEGNFQSVPVLLTKEEEVLLKKANNTLTVPTSYSDSSCSTYID